MLSLCHSRVLQSAEMQVLSHPEEESTEGIISMRIKLGCTNSSTLSESNVSQFGRKKKQVKIFLETILI